MGYLGKIQDTAGNVHLIGSTLYGTCDTDAATVEKVVTCADFNSSTIPTGLTLRVKFTYGNTSSTVSLKLGSLIHGISAPNTWSDGDIVAFTFNGTAWQITGGIDSTRLPIDGGKITGDIQMASGKVYWGGETDNVKIWRDNNSLALQSASTINLNSSTSVGGNLTVQSSYTLTAALKDCTLNNDLNAVSNSILFGPNASTRGTIGYDSGLTLQFQGSKITMTSSSLKLYSSSWLTGTGTNAVIPTSGANTNIIVKSSSSKRYKDDITYDLDKEKFHSTLMQMKPCQFHYKTEPDLNQYGFIAEDIEELDTKLCIYENDGQVENYLDRGILALIVTELQRKDEEIKELKERIKKLENKGG